MGATTPAAPANTNTSRTRSNTRARAYRLTIASAMTASREFPMAMKIEAVSDPDVVMLTRKAPIATPGHN